MASGFIVLPDGRCFSRVWRGHDAILRTIAERVTDAAFREWLFAQLPGPDDEVELGFGAWYRKSDQSTIVRFIDLRLVTEDNQRCFCEAVKLGASLAEGEEWLRRSLGEFADMVVRMERGEPPLSKSDWREVVPPEGERIGPGWDAK